MSSLVKHYTVTGEEARARVIDSNSLAQKKIEAARQVAEQKRQAEIRQRMAEAGEGEFVEGILPSATLQAELEEEIARAKEEAEEIVTRARAEAEQILENARMQGETIKEDAKQSGYAAGKEEGQAQADQALSLRMQELEAQRQQLLQAHQDAMDALEPELLDVILRVFNRVFHIQFDDKKDILEYLIVNTIMNVEGSKEFRIKTSEDNYPYISSHMKGIQEQVGREYVLEVITDSTLGENKCVIETDAGYFDCSLGIHLENLTKDLKSICSLDAIQKETDE